MAINVGLIRTRNLVCQTHTKSYLLANRPRGLARPYVAGVARSCAHSVQLACLSACVSFVLQPEGLARSGRVAPRLCNLLLKSQGGLSLVTRDVLARVALAGATAWQLGAGARSATHCCRPRRCVGGPRRAQFRPARSCATIIGRLSGALSPFQLDLSIRNSSRGAKIATRLTRGTPQLLEAKGR